MRLPGRSAVPLRHSSSSVITALLWSRSRCRLDSYSRASSTSLSTPPSRRAQYKFLISPRGVGEALEFRLSLYSSSFWSFSHSVPLGGRDGVEDAAVGCHSSSPSRLVVGVNEAEVGAVAVLEVGEDLAVASAVSVVEAGSVAVAAAPAGDLMATMTLDQLVEQLTKVYGAELRAVVLYGSAAAGQHVAKRSDYNVLVIVDSLDVDSLSRGAAVAGAWSESGNPPPLTLTTSEWRSSADIFPMEYADILGRHKVLHGNPPFDGISVDPRHLRLELEQQAMGKLLQLRQGIFAAHGEWKRQAELLSASLTTFMVIFRALLRLHGEEPPTDYTALTERVAALSGIDSASFTRVVRHVRGEERLSEKEVATVLAGYLAGAQRLKTHIDQL